MKFLSSFVFVFLLLHFLLAIPPVPARADTVETLVESLTPVYYPASNAAARAILPPDSLGWQTPTQSHNVFAVFTIGRELFAACSPVKLSFFGTKDTISPELCKQPNFAKTHMLGFYYMMLLAYENQAGPLHSYLMSHGVDPDVSRGDMKTPQGWAFWNAHRFVTKYLASDGWNMLGHDRPNKLAYMDLHTAMRRRFNYRKWRKQNIKRRFNKIDVEAVQYSGRFPRRYTDTTGYRPRNPAQLATSHLHYPLRWQPLTEHIDGYGDWSSQVHITPHIGEKVKPLSMDMDSWNNIRAHPPYHRPAMYGKVSKPDRRTLLGDLVPHMFREMRGVFTSGAENKRQKQFRGRWWDNKFASLGSVGPTYDFLLGVPPAQVWVAGMGENMALHDATVLAWREKVRNDLGRPGPILRHLLKGKNVTVYDADDEMARSVPIEEWEPAVRTMPHSEFPSGSSVLCGAVVEFVRLHAEYKTGGNYTNPGMTHVYKAGMFPNLPNVDITIRYETFDEIVDDCGMSRIWSGLHFRPSITEGARIGREVGRRTFDTWLALEQGRVPNHCRWCLN